MAKICRYALDFHRSSKIEGVMIVSPDEYRTLANDVSGHEISYGEISGKHSDVSEKFDIMELEIVSEREDDIKFFTKLFPKGYTGFNFKAYWLNMFFENLEEDGYAESHEYDNIEEALKTTGYRGKAAEAYATGFKEGKEDS